MTTKIIANNKQDNKSETLYQLLLSTFDVYRKNASKRDSYFQDLKDSYTKLKECQDFNTPKQITFFTTILINSLTTKVLKIIEKTISTTESIVLNDLLDSKILSPMLSNMLLHLYDCSKQNDDVINMKILSLSIVIFQSNNTHLHGKNIIYMIQINLYIYLVGKNTQYQSNAKNTIQKLIEILLNKIEGLYTQYQIKSIIRKTGLGLLNDNDEVAVMTNEYTFKVGRHLSFITDMICNTVDSPDKQSNFIKEYSNSVMNKGKDDKTKGGLQLQLEALGLNNKDNDGIVNELDYYAGKYGWCIQCRKVANIFSEKLQYPICSSTCQNDFEKINQQIENEKIFSSNDLIKDYLEVLKYLVKTSINEASKEGDVHRRTKEICLEMLQILIAKGKKYFYNNTTVVNFIKDSLMDSLVKNSLANDSNIFRQSINLFLTIISNYRERLKNHMEIFIRRVLISILESENLGFAYKEILLDSLIDLSQKSNFLVEVYINYDCDLKYKSIFTEIIDLLTKIIINGMYKKAKYSNTIKPMQENILRNKCIDCLICFNRSLNNLVENSRKDNNTLHDNMKDNKDNIVDESIMIDNDETFQTIESMSNSFGSNMLDIADKINQSIQRKKLLDSAIVKFNISPNKCLAYLQKLEMILSESLFNQYKARYLDPNQSSKSSFSYDKIKEDEINMMQIPFLSNVNPLVLLMESFDNNDEIVSFPYEDYTAYEMTRFIRTNITKLKKDSVGEFLSSSKPFSFKVATAFIDSFNFKDMHLVDALRLLFSEFPVQGEGQIIDRIMKIFGHKYYKDCKKSTLYKNIYNTPDDGYSVGFSVIMLNTDLHRPEVDKKMSVKDYLNVKEIISETITEEYLEKVYYMILENPLLIPGQKIISNKKKEELLKQEKDNIIRSTTIHQKNIKNNKEDYYITTLDNENVKQLLEDTWSNFLSIFSQLLADADDEPSIISYIENILLLAKTSGIIQLTTTAEVSINTIINLTFLMDAREITLKNIQCSKALIRFIVDNGTYIKTGWYTILNSMSKIEQYQTLGGQLKNESSLFIQEIRNKSKLKNPDKEIEIEFANSDLICKNIPGDACEKIFSNTFNLDEEGILDFVSSLCKVSKNELDHIHNQRVYSLHKLVEVAAFNINRIQIVWVKIWKLISDHFVNVLSTCNQDIIWNDAFDSLRQTVNKLLKKPDNSMYSYQINFFKPFEKLFDQSTIPWHTETIIMCIQYFIQQPENIHSGWVVLFRILQKGLKRKEGSLNKIIIQVLQTIKNNFFIFTNPTTHSLNFDVFRGYIECLYYIHLDHQMKPIAFEMITDVMNKIIADIGKDEKKSQYDLVLIFFFGFDGLISLNPIEHVNLIFELIEKNKTVLMKSEAFVYLYYCYFKPHVCSMLLYYYDYRLNIFAIENRKKYEKYHKEGSIDDILFNLRLFLEDSLEDDLKRFIDDNEHTCLMGNVDNEKKKEMICFIKGIKSVYEKESDLLMNKLETMKSFDEKNYELSMEFFIEKFLEMITKKSKETTDNNSIDKEINFNFFYEDIIITLASLSLFSSHSNIIFKIIQKNLISICNANILSQSTWNKINEETMFILSSIASSNTQLTEIELNDLLAFTSSFADFYHNLLQNFSKVFNNNNNDQSLPNDSYKIDFKVQYKLLNFIIRKLLQIDLENSYKEYTIITSSITIDIFLSVAKIRKCLIEKQNDISSLYDPSSMFVFQYLHKIFLKYQLNIFDTHPMLDVLNFELESILPYFLKYLTDEELKKVFGILMDFVDTKNDRIRKSSKSVMKQYHQNQLCLFVSMTSKNNKD